MDAQKESTGSREFSTPKLYVDNCVGILQEVPDYFDFGTLRVRLSTLDISPGFISLGSRCGALFLFNREYGRALKPLRTTYNEICTCQSWFVRNDQNFLAIGHRSGTLILICLPSGKPGANRKLKQSIHEDAHKGHEISCVIWSEDGRNVYSADLAGLILCINVNFDEEIYKIKFIYDGQEPIKFLQTTSNYLIACFSRFFIIFDISETEETVSENRRPLIAQHELPQKAIGLISSDLELVFLLEDARLVRFTVGKDSLDVMCELNDQIVKPLIMPDLFIGGMPRELVHTEWNMEDFKEARARFYTSHLLLYSSDKVYLLEQTDSIKFTQKILLHLKLQLRNSENMEILDCIFDEQSGEVFALTSTQKLIRFSSDPPTDEVIVFKDGKTPSLLSSISSVAQKSSKKWFQKFAAAGEFQQFEVPVQLPNLKLNDGQAVVEEYGAKLVNNFNSLIENLKGPLVNNNDSDQESRSSRSQSQVTDNSQITGTNDPAIYEPKVNVKHKTRIKRAGKSSVSQSMSEIEKDKLDDHVVEVSSENLDRLIGALNNFQLEPVDQEEIPVENPDEIKIDKELIPTTSQSENQPHSDLHTPAESEEESEHLTANSIEELLNEQKNKSKSTSSQTSITSEKRPMIDTSNFCYPLITKQANLQTDIWNRIKLPYNATWFDACANYMVICSNKRKERPQYRLFVPLDNGILGGDWTELKYYGSLVAVNDSGSLLWRVESGVAFAPHKIDPMSPFSTYWLEQANEGKIESVALTSTSAWYLTKNGPSVQMNLPEMGIYFRAECPYTLSQIVATDQAVWGLRSGVGTLVVRVGLKHCPMGMDWVEQDSDNPRSFVSIALYEKTGFGLDSNENLWICNGVDLDKPFGTGVWHQACSPTNAVLPLHRKKFSPISQWRLKVCASGVFINVGPFVLSARQPLTAHSLQCALPSTMDLNNNFGLLTASAFVGSSLDHIYVCQPNGEIFAYSTQNQNLTSLPLFNSICSIVAISAARDCLYVLDSCGVVHVRDNLNSLLTPRGKTWSLLSTKSLTSTIISFAASSTSLWAVTADNCIWHSDLFSIPAETDWHPVDKPVNIDIEVKLDQIRCSPSGKYVWVISSMTSKMWARCEVSESGRCGWVWSEACNDIKMSELAVADNAVYALSTANKQLYRLRSLSVSNPAGLYWKPMPIKLRAISVDAFEQRLWGLDMDNRLVKHMMQIYPRSCIEHQNATEESESTTESGSTSKAKLFRVHSNDSSQAYTNEWEDVTTE